MIILGLNSENSLIYVYSEDKEKVSRLLDAIEKGKVSNGFFYKEYLVIVKERDSGNYYFFYDEYKNVKDAKHATKVLLKAVLQTFSINDTNMALYKNSEHIILHNAKNIIHKLTTGLRAKLNYDVLVYQDDKVKYINDLIKDDTFDYAREFLRCEKSLEQVSYEYNCLDLISSGELLDATERSQERIHSCLVQAFYIYENEFKEKNIKVQIEQNRDSIFCNFFSIRSAFALLFENCTKYCKSNTDIIVSANKQSNGSVKIDFDMTSVFNSEEDLKKVFLEHERGEEAKKKDSGQGLGLFLVQRLLEINGFSICLKSMPNTDSYDERKIHYSRNLYVIDIPEKFVIKN